MKISEWWQHNAKYVKAWLSFGVLLWAFQFIVVMLDWTQAPLMSLGLSESAARHTRWIISILMWIPFSYFAFRSVVRKFIRQNPE